MPGILCLTVERRRVKNMCGLNWKHLKQSKWSPRSLFPWGNLFQSRAQNLTATETRLWLPFRLSIRSALWTRTLLHYHQPPSSPEHCQRKTIGLKLGKTFSLIYRYMAFLNWRVFETKLTRPHPECTKLLSSIGDCCSVKGSLDIGSWDKRTKPICDISSTLQNYKNGTKNWTT